MNDYQLIQYFLDSGEPVEVWGGRKVKITGFGPTGSAACIAVDGGDPIYSISTAFLLLHV